MSSKTMPQHRCMLPCAVNSMNFLCFLSSSPHIPTDMFSSSACLVSFPIFPTNRIQKGCPSYLYMCWYPTQDLVCTQCLLNWADSWTFFTSFISFLPKEISSNSFIHHTCVYSIQSLCMGLKIHHLKTATALDSSQTDNSQIVNCRPLLFTTFLGLISCSEGLWS